MIKIEDLRKLETNDLLKQISELKGKLLALRFESAAGSLKESHLIKETKKDIAKVFTILNERKTQAWKLGEEEKAKAKKANPVKQVVKKEPRKKPLRKVLKEQKLKEQKLKEAEAV